MSFPAHLTELENRIRARFEAAVGELRKQYQDRLRQVSDEMISGFGEIAPPTDPLAELEIADLELAAPGGDRGAGFADLIEGFRALDRAGTQSEALDALLRSSLRFAARAGLLLVRDDGASGWGSAGFDGDPFAGREVDWSDDLLGRLAAGRGAVRLDAVDARRLAERLGLAGAGERAVLVPLVLRDRVAAALYADAVGGGALEIEALQLLVLATADRIELQALSSRGFTPTLYDAEGAPGAGLSLWSGAPAAAEARAPEPAAPVAPPPPAPAAVAPAPAPEPAPAPALEPPPAPALEPPPAPAPEPEGAPVESLFTSAEPEEEAWAAEPEEEAWAAEPAPPPLELEEEPTTDAGAAGFEVEAEGGAEPAAAFGDAPEAPVEELGALAPEAPAAPPLGEATVRIPAYREPVEEPAPTPLEETPEPAEEPVEEPSAAPVEEEGGALAFPGTTTQEIPRAEPEPTPAPDEDETVLARPPAADPLEAPTAARDVTEDATVLMDRSAGAAAEPAAATPAAAEPGEEVGEETVDRTGARAGRTTEVAPPPDVRGPGLAFGAARPGAPTGGENALHDEARRLARLLVSEIKLYNEEQVHEGRRNRDLYIRLKEDIDRSRQIYDERVHESVRAEADYFHQELVRSLAGGDSRALGM